MHWSVLFLATVNAQIVAAPAPAGQTPNWMEGAAPPVPVPPPAPGAPRIAASDSCINQFAKYSRVALHVENDTWFDTDQSYTNGLRLVYATRLSVESCTELRQAAGKSGLRLDQFGAFDFGVVGGQSIYTPQNIRTENPSPNDRPYAGWLYAGAVLRGVSLNREDRRESAVTLELDLGMIGPHSYAGWVQTKWHQFDRWRTSDPESPPEPKGWGRQIPTSLGVRLSGLYERSIVNSRIVEFGVLGQGDVGNVFDLLAIGGWVRFGWMNMDAAPGQPAAAATNKAGSFWDNVDGYVFARGRAKVVFFNVFLDGTAFRESPQVPKAPVVADGELGAGVRIYRVQCEGGSVHRSPEMQVPYDDPIVMRGKSPWYGHGYRQIQCGYLWPL